MHDTFNVGYEVSGYFFLAIGLGYTLSCLVLPYYIENISNMRVSIISAFILGIVTLFYGASNILQLNDNMLILVIALLFAGFASGHLTVAPMDELLTVSQEINNDRKSEKLNDM
mmetsp:Transcript_10179/g.11612  ORF Transcript_10179/g.11612 Transcript_10179/m.11612 type:complete len:114 (+) Transcript_10179:914-1255(+)